MHDLIPIFDDHSHFMVNEMLKKANCCPECGARNHAFVAKAENTVRRPRYVITCGECKYQGPFGKDFEDAVRQWNKPPGFFALMIRRWKWKRDKQRQHQTKLPQKKSGAA
ncbi:MAG: hypothetical protein WCD70_07765 [Alphaproteobacteria bacterium]